MNKLCVFSMLVLLTAAATTVQAETDQNALVVTASNDTTSNQLMVYNSRGRLIQMVDTHGQKGGVGGNAGGIEAKGNLVAVVNFGSQSVSVFERKNEGFQMKQSVPAVSRPVSVAFGADHLYILGTTTVESHGMNGPHVDSSPDGVVSLLSADGSAAQVGVVKNQLIITEKTFMGGPNGVIETVNLLPDGTASGVSTLVQNIPANPLAPFGLVTRRDNAYVTIAHSDEITLVRNGKVLTVTGSGTQHAPCWVALVGPFLFSSNSPSKSVSRYAVYGQQIVQDAAIAASLAGNPTDIASGKGLVAVIDGLHLSIFSVDEDGNLTLKGTAPISSATNGVAVVWNED
jgi:hypothetical protein